MSFDNSQIDPPFCLNCANRMQLHRVIARTDVQGQLNVFLCKSCGLYYTTSADERGRDGGDKDR
jgi:transcription elongation factor Elf1